MLELRNINKVYIHNVENNIKTHALSDINFVLGRTGFVAIIGKSGSGKTTLLNLIGAIDKPTSGEIIYLGKSLNEYTQLDFDDYRNRHLAFVFQDYNLLDDYTVLDNVKLAIRLQEKSEAVIESLARESLRKVGLSGYENRSINTLSGGEQQRVAIARALAKRSRIILCDEPTGNLDSTTALEIIEILKEIAKERLVLVVTHDIDIADYYADRIIKLKDGKVIEDSTVALPTDTDANYACSIKGEYRGMALKDSLTMIKHNIFKSLIPTIMLVLILMLVFSLTTIFSSLATYNPQDSFVETLKANDQYVIQITKYVDEQREVYIPASGQYQKVNGPELVYELVKESDIPALYQLTDNQAHFYPSYFFQKNLQDFIDSFIYTHETLFIYEQIGFREAIAVPDFSTFHLKLAYGGYPVLDNDILIYDYMAHNLLHYGVLGGEIGDLVDQTLTDIHTGLTLRIAGIIKSDYLHYEYIKENLYSDYEFEKSYLTSLQSIFCKPELIEILSQEKNYDSVLKAFFMRSTDGGTIETNFKKLKYTEIADLHFLAALPNYENERGIILSKAQLAEILDLSPDDVSVETAQNFLENFHLAGYDSYYLYTFERTYYGGLYHKVIGISDNLVNEEGVLNLYTPHAEDLQRLNGDFRQIYLSLGKDWNLNQGILDKFICNSMSADFYAANPDYYAEGYTDYTPYGILVRNAIHYLTKVKDFSQDIMLILIILSLVGLVFFILHTIKKYSYKIGVLKALGTRNADIALIFGLQIIILTLFAFILSLPLGYFLMGNINADFVRNLNSNLIFFSIKPITVLIMFLTVFVGVLITTSIPLLRIYFALPITIIKKVNKKSY